MLNFVRSLRRSLPRRLSWLPTAELFPLVARPSSPRMHQSARLIAAQVSRRCANPMGGGYGRCCHRQYDHAARRRLDTGPILLQQTIEIGPDETSVSLFDRMARQVRRWSSRRSPACVRAPFVLRRKIIPAHLRPLLDREDGRMDFARERRTSSLTAGAGSSRGQRFHHH